MRSFLRAVFIALIALSFHLFGLTRVEAKCTRLAFSVNDYGKDGPTEDAKKLLDGYIVKWTGERSISGYKVGKKSVKCELFLDFIVFDEYTCRAEASVCWDENPAEPVLRPALTTDPLVIDNSHAQTAQSNAPVMGAKVKAPVQPTSPAPVVKSAPPPRTSASSPQGGYNSVYDGN